MHAGTLQGDYNNQLVRRIDIASQRVSTLAGVVGVTGTANGVGTAAFFQYPSGVALVSTGTFALVVSMHPRLLHTRYEFA